MTVLCPSGHTSATTDYCDQCGVPIAAPPAPAPLATEVHAVGEEADTSPATRHEPCPMCGAEHSGGDRYCEGCGHDFLAPRAAALAWEAVAMADHQQFERYGSSGLLFPTRTEERRFALVGAEVRIGRSRAGAGDSGPEIDLAGIAEDPGISRLHAVLERQPDGSYALRDLGSTNGTTVNDDPDPVGHDAAVPLADGDRIRLGAWTTITLRTLKVRNRGERVPPS